MVLHAYCTYYHPRKVILLKKVIKTLLHRTIVQGRPRTVLIPVCDHPISVVECKNVISIVWPKLSCQVSLPRQFSFKLKCIPGCFTYIYVGRDQLNFHFANSGFLHDKMCNLQGSTQPRPGLLLLEEKVPFQQKIIRHKKTGLKNNKSVLLSKGILLPHTFALRENMSRDIKLPKWSFKNELFWAVNGVGSI